MTRRHLRLPQHTPTCTTYLRLCPPQSPTPARKSSFVSPRSQYLDGRRTVGKPAHKVLSHSEWAANMAFMGTNVGAFPPRQATRGTPRQWESLWPPRLRIGSSPKRATRRRETLPARNTHYSPHKGLLVSPPRSLLDSPRYPLQASPPFGREEIRGKRRGKTYAGPYEYNYSIRYCKKKLMSLSCFDLRPTPNGRRAIF